MTGRSAVREFADLVDGTSAGSDTLDAELRDLLRAVSGLTTLGAAVSEATELPEDVRARQRARLLAVAHVEAQSSQTQSSQTQSSAAQPSRKVRWERVRWERRAHRLTVGLAGACAVTVGFTGVGVAAHHSLPGMPFYGVKRGTEAIQLAIPRSDTSEGNLRLAIAKTRLREVEGLVDDDDHLAVGRMSGGASGVVALSASSKADLIRQTLDDMDKETRQGTALLTKVARTQQDADPLWKIWTFADEQQKRLQTILPDLSREQQTFASSSLTVVADVKVQMQSILVTEFHATLPPAVTNPQPPAPGTGGSGGTGGTGGNGSGGSVPTGTPSPTPSPQPTDPAPPTEDPTPPPPPATEEPPATPPEEPTPTDSPTDQPTDAPTDAPTPPGDLVDPLVSLLGPIVPSLLDGLLNPPTSP